MGVPSFLVGLLLLAGCAALPPTPVEDPVTNPPRTPAEGPSEPRGTGARGVPATVTDVTDGDTVAVVLRGRELDVRLIGVDTPETVHPSEPVGCFGPEASRFTGSRLGGARVRLEFDVERIDQYGRTLAYVWIGGRLFNEVLVREGFAQVATYPPNVKYVERFLRAQRLAREESAGLWGGCGIQVSTAGRPHPGRGRTLLA